ncbi:MAG: hypothetical protein ABI682_14295 [Acidobacteriota bacterium]
MVRTTAQRPNGKTAGTVIDSSEAVSFHSPDRYTRSGHTVGDICFECECRIFEIGGPEGLLLAWCDCGYPDDHGEMEIV